MRSAPPRRGVPLRAADRLRSSRRRAAWCGDAAGRKAPSPADQAYLGFPSLQRRPRRPVFGLTEFDADMPDVIDLDEL